MGFLYLNKAYLCLEGMKITVQSTTMSSHAARSALKQRDAVYYCALRDKYCTHHCVPRENMGWFSLATRRLYT